jgi:hypothetical protein
MVQLRSREVRRAEAAVAPRLRASQLDRLKSKFLVAAAKTNQFDSLRNEPGPSLPLHGLLSALD